MNGNLSVKWFSWYFYCTICLFSRSSTQSVVPSTTLGGGARLGNPATGQHLMLIIIIVFSSNLPTFYFKRSSCFALATRTPRKHYHRPHTTRRYRGAILFGVDCTEVVSLPVASPRQR